MTTMTTRDKLLDAASRALAEDGVAGCRRGRWRPAPR